MKLDLTKGLTAEQLAALESLGYKVTPPKSAREITNIHAGSFAITGQGKDSVLQEVTAENNSKFGTVHNGLLWTENGKLRAIGKAKIGHLFKCAAASKYSFGDKDKATGLKFFVFPLGEIPYYLTTVDNGVVMEARVPALDADGKAVTYKGKDKQGNEVIRTRSNDRPGNLSSVYNSQSSFPKAVWEYLLTLAQS